MVVPPTPAAVRALTVAVRAAALERVRLRVAELDLLARGKLTVSRGEAAVAHLHEAARCTRTRTRGTTARPPPASPHEQHEARARSRRRRTALITAEGERRRRASVRRVNAFECTVCRNAATNDGEPQPRSLDEAAADEGASQGDAAPRACCRRARRRTRAPEPGEDLGHAAHACTNGWTTNALVARTLLLARPEPSDAASISAERELAVAQQAADEALASRRPTARGRRSTPWNWCCSRPRSTSMRLSRRRARKPPNAMARAHRRTSAHMHGCDDQHERRHAGRDGVAAEQAGRPWT